MRFGKAAGLLVAGLAVAAAVYIARELVGSREPEVAADQPATTAEPARAENVPEPPDKTEGAVASAQAAPPPETFVEPARSDVAPVAAPVPSGEPAPPAGSLRDPRALIGAEATERSVDATASRSPESGSPVAGDRDTSLGHTGPTLVDARPLTVAAATVPTSDARSGEAALDRRAPAAVPLQDSRALASTPFGTAAARSLGPEPGDAKVASALPDPFRDERALAPSIGRDALALQDARALVPVDPGATAARRPVPERAQERPPERAQERPLSEPIVRAETGTRADDSRSAARSPQIAATATATATVTSACEAPAIATTALDDGRMRLLLKSECRASQDAQLAYGGATLIRRIDAAGLLDFTLDAFVGATSALEITLADGQRKTVPVVANNLDRLAKVAVIWRAPVNLDLHAFEYASPFGQAGHVWERKPLTRVAAQEIMRAGRRGRGFLSTADDGRSVGDKLEVYTFLHHDEQATGVVGLSVDYETRGELPSGATCGAGAFAEVGYQFSILSRAGQVTRENGVLAPAPCGVRVAPEARFDPLLLPALRVRK